MEIIDLYRNRSEGRQILSIEVLYKGTVREIVLRTTTWNIIRKFLNKLNLAGPITVVSISACMYDAVRKGITHLGDIYECGMYGYPKAYKDAGYFITTVLYNHRLMGKVLYKEVLPEDLSRKTAGALSEIAHILEEI